MALQLPDRRFKSGRGLHMFLTPVKRVFSFFNDLKRLIKFSHEIKKECHIDVKW
jgi:hypothetical protein